MVQFYLKTTVFFNNKFFTPCLTFLHMEPKTAKNVFVL